MLIAYMVKNCYKSNDSQSACQIQNMTTYKANIYDHNYLMKNNACGRESNSKNKK